MQDRTRKSTINIVSGIMLQIVSILCGFITRNVFLHNLGVDLLGVNTTLTSIISMLSLTDLGLNLAIYAALYKPIAQGERSQIIAITNLCEKLYKLIACAIFAIGIILLPFLQFFFSEADLQIVNIQYIRYVFILFLIDTAISYLFSYRWVLFNADQNTYVISRANTIYTIVLSLLQILIIVITNNYILYLIIKTICVLLKNIYLTWAAGKKYDFLQKKEKVTLDPAIKKSIMKNTGALALHRLANYAISGTDTLIISKFIGIAVTAVYSNYNMIILSVTQVITQFTEGVSASLANVLVTESMDKTYTVFRTINFTNFIFYNFAATSILILTEPFITLWLGEEYTLAFDTVIVLTLNFFNIGVSAPLGTIRANAGLFEPDRLLQILFALLNLVVSILLVKPFGITGVFVGTLASYVAREIITIPNIVYKNIFKLPVSSYYKTYFSYLCIWAFSAISTYIVSNLFLSFVGDIPLIAALMLKAVFCVILPNCIALVFFAGTTEFKNLISILHSQIIQLFNR